MHCILNAGKLKFNDGRQKKILYFFYCRATAKSIERAFKK
jgi:hypothetical protein